MYIYRNTSFDSLTDYTLCTDFYVINFEITSARDTNRPFPLR